MSEIEHLTRWLRVKDIEQAFPREAGLKRDIAVTPEAFMEYVYGCIEEMKDCYASVFSIRQIRENRYDTIFLDVDNHDDADKLRSKLDEYGFEYREYDSGRGRHFYLDFEEEYLPEYKSGVREFVVKVLKVNDIVDMHVVGDVRRMARVPMTYNTRVGKFSTVINDNVGLNKELPKIIKELGKLSNTITRVDSDKCNMKTIEMFKGSKLPLCIEDLINKAIREQHLQHHERLIVATFMLTRYTKSEVREIFKLCSDYNKVVTDYNLSWIIEKGYMPYSCDKIKSYGLCRKICEYYPWMGKIEQYGVVKNESAE
jgi:hypothetical protein